MPNMSAIRNLESNFYQYTLVPKNWKSAAYQLLNRKQLFAITLIITLELMTPYSQEVWRHNPFSDAYWIGIEWL